MCVFYTRMQCPAAAVFVELVLGGDLHAVLSQGDFTFLFILLKSKLKVFSG